jgi:hypothetical protein
VQATALLGAHSLGGMSPANSGFGVKLSQQPVQTPWVENNAVFSNDYYKQLLGVPFNDGGAFIFRQRCACVLSHAAELE